ncbi:MAG: patatin-like phospholipase family protein [bacterium]
MSGAQAHDALAGTALALSGGGYRATLFHIGSLTRLNELGWLPRLDIIASVSGGSIIGGWLGCNWRSLEFRDGVAVNFDELVAAPVRRLCAQRIDVASLWSFPLHLRGNGSRLGLLFARHLTGQRTLADLAGTREGEPLFEIMATNLLSGGSVALSALGVEDSMIGVLPRTDMPLSRAIAASCALPPYFSPLSLRAEPHEWQLAEGERLAQEPQHRRKLVLADGGVFDNLGMEGVLDRCRTLLFSDASSLFSPWNWMARDRMIQLMRANTVLVSRLRRMRKRYLLEQRLGNPEHPQSGAYWGISSEIASFGLDDALGADSQLSASLAYVRTRLSTFSEQEQGQLINWGYALADAGMRRYLAAEGPAPQWPCPSQSL